METNSKQSCETNAKIFIKAYKDFIKPYIDNEKIDFLKEKQEEFYKSFNRKSLQELIDIEIVKCQDPNILYQYLKNPADMMTNHYNQELYN